MLPWQDVALVLSLEPGEDIIRAEAMPLVEEAWQKACALVGLPVPEHFPFHISSSIPVGAGFGSSAALCVSLLRAACEKAKVSFETDQLIAHATALESLFHGRSSGLDPTIAVIQQPLRFHMKEPRQAFPWRLDGYGFVLGLTHEQRQTAVAVGKVRAFSEQSPVRFAKMLSEMNGLVPEIRELIASADSGTDVHQRAMRLGELLHRNHVLLREVGVSSEGLEHLVEAAMGAGAIGAKLTGAGLGGGMVALAPHDALPSLRQALLAAGATHCEVCLP